MVSSRALTRECGGQKKGQEQKTNSVKMLDGLVKSIVCHGRNCIYNAKLLDCHRDKKIKKRRERERGETNVQESTKQTAENFHFTLFQLNFWSNYLGWVE